MDDLDRTQLEQVLRLAKENNHMLRSMRRNAWLGGIIKLLIYAGLIVIPFWLYLQYLAPVMGALTSLSIRSSKCKERAHKSLHSLVSLTKPYRVLRRSFRSFSRVNSTEG